MRERIRLYSDDKEGGYFTLEVRKYHPIGNVYMFDITYHSKRASMVGRVGPGCKTSIILMEITKVGMPLTDLYPPSLTTKIKKINFKLIG